MNKQHQPISLLIADDHELLRNGLVSILSKEPGLDIKGIAANGAELVELARLHQPDVILTDIVMPVIDGIEAIRQIRRFLPATEIIALSMFDDELLIINVLEAGATGYLLKNADKSEILSAIRSASEHEHYYCREISMKLAKYATQSKLRHQPIIAFTPKELEIIRYICQEFTTQQIGLQLYLSKRTIDGYRSSILNKMKVKSTAGIVIYAIQHNLFDLRELKQD
jgi:two-component system, NarL family, response regulator NreC